jgi:hypothetical protein
MLRRWATASRKFMLEAIAGGVALVGFLVLEGLSNVLLVDVKGRDGEVVAVTTGEFEKGMAVLAGETVNGTRRRRPLSKVGSSGAVIAMARTRRARRSALLVRIICCEVRATA